MTSEWKGALRLQIEALARRNDLHRRCVRESVQKRTKEMDQKIIKMRELLSTDANQAAQFYLECVCHADETERILNRTSSRDKKHQKRKENGLRHISSFQTAVGTRSLASTSPVEVISADALPHASQTPSRSIWWNLGNRKDEQNPYDCRQLEIRQLWHSQSDFISHSLSLVIGVGNVIRFPAAVYRFGGTFLLPYVLLHLFVGFPLIFLQFSIGQFSALGPVSALGRMASVASGLGWTLVLFSIPFAIYFNLYASWFLYYLIDIIFSSTTAWIHCGGSFNSSRVCCPIDQLEFCRDANHTVLSTETFMHSTILHVAGATLGSLQAPLVSGLAVAWILTVLIYLKPSPTTHLTSTLPFFALILLALAGSSLPGAQIGFSYLFSFKLKQFYSIDLWLFAMEQVLFELALCGGPLIALASLNRFRNNIFRDSAIISVSTIICSFLSAIVVFCFAGNLVAFSGIEMRKLAAYDPRYFSLIVLPSMTHFIQGGNFWFGLLLISMILAVIDTQYSWIRCLSSCISSKFSNKNAQNFDTRLFILISLISFFCGLPLCTLGGVYIFHSIDCVIAIWTVSLTLFLLLLLITQSYGVKNFLRDLSCMQRIPLHQRWSLLGFYSRLNYLFGPVGVFIKYSWTFLTPFVLLVATVLFLIIREPITFARNPIPWPYELAARIIVILPLLPIPIIFFFKFFKSRRNGKTFFSLFDSSKWSQLDSNYENEPEESPLNSKKRRTAMRENTYMYIDPLSRGNTERSVTAIQIEDNYGWRVGRLKEVQADRSLQPSESQNSFEMSIASQTTTAKGEFNLFGSPPASNAFIMAEVIANRAAATRRQRAFSASQSPTPPQIQVTEMFNKTSCVSEPPIVPNTPPPRSSPGAKSEPPRAMTDRPSSSLRSKSTCDSNSSDEEDGINPQRITVIRRFCSEDSFGPQSNTSISITPIDRLTDVDRMRSMSSLAIYDPQTENRPRQQLSQLKRPQPINAPNKSPIRF